MVLDENCGEKYFLSFARNESSISSSLVNRSNVSAGLLTEPIPNRLDRSLQTTAPPPPSCHRVGKTFLRRDRAKKISQTRLAPTSYVCGIITTLRKKPIKKNCRVVCCCCYSSLHCLRDRPHNTAAMPANRNGQAGSR